MLFRSTFSANEIAERVVDEAIALDHDSAPGDDDECFVLSVAELRSIVVAAFADYIDARVEVEPDPVVDWKRHQHKRVEKSGRAVCDGCGVDL